MSTPNDLRYYFDDASVKTVKQLGRFPSDKEALEVALKIIENGVTFPCILYDEHFRTVKEWKERGN